LDKKDRGSALPPFLSHPPLILCNCQLLWAPLLSAAALHINYSLVLTFLCAAFFINFSIPETNVKNLENI